MTSKRALPDLGEEALAQLFAAHVASTDTKHLSGDYYHEYEGFVLGSPADEAFAMVVRLCERAPDDSALGWIGVVFVEPSSIFTGGPSATASNGRRQTAIAAQGVLVRVAPPPRRGRELEARLEALVQPGEDVGRRQSGCGPQPVTPPSPP